MKNGYPGWRHLYSGKVRELYESELDNSSLLIVASDRISAFDHLLNPPIDGKGALLTSLSKWWFSHLNVPNHLFPEGPKAPAELADRSMVTKRLNMAPIECVVRAAITGSGYAEYLETGAVCGVSLPSGLNDGDLLETPIFTPAYKAPQGEHDENISFDKVCEIVGEELATRLRSTSLHIFEIASKLAHERGLILADTKFEFGINPETGELTLADEVLTSDSSRYWDAKNYYQATGKERMLSFDKQIVRDWLKLNWNGEGDPPSLPPEIVEKTKARYAELLEKFDTKLA